MSFERLWIDFAKIVFFENFLKIFDFLAIFGPKSCFWPFSNFSRPKSKNTFWWTCPPFYYGHFKLSTRSLGFKIRMGGKFSYFSLSERKISKSQGGQKSTLANKKIFEIFVLKCVLNDSESILKKKISKIFENFRFFCHFLAKNHVFGHCRIFLGRNQKSAFWLTF